MSGGSDPGEGWARAAYLASLGGVAAAASRGVAGRAAAVRRPKQDRCMRHDPVHKLPTEGSSTMKGDRVGERRGHDTGARRRVGHAVTAQQGPQPPTGESGSAAPSAASPYCSQNTHTHSPTQAAAGTTGVKALPNPGASRPLGAHDLLSNCDLTNSPVARCMPAIAIAIASHKLPTVPSFTVPECVVTTKQQAL